MDDFGFLPLRLHFTMDNGYFGCVCVVLVKDNVPFNSDRFFLWPVDPVAFRACSAAREFQTCEFVYVRIQQ